MAETVPPVAPAAAAAAADNESVSFSSSCACAVDANAATEPLDLEGLVAAIKEELARCKQTHISKQFGLQEILRRFDASNGDLERYAHFDASKKYTRNLIATDGETFTLMLLCWTPGKESPIHDHPCDGCWMRVVDGTVFESKFRRDVASNRLEPLGTAEATPGEVIYINDQIALHKVGNPSPTEGAVTLHLYSPPFRQCQVWLERMGEGVGPTLAGGEGEAAPLPVLLDRGLKTIVTFHSEFGEVLLHEQQAGGPAAGAGGPSLCK